ncbi:ADP-ribosylglycohydrolase family protein [Arthrobacter sp. RAF14]|uniref:ADP-ribosylglycohydrolase family protein n=1 Tax=Arthrobacter sp. RAF14 TaxID=3233051 RepID=UPI003F8E3F87
MAIASKIRGTLLGGALGDALGYVVEFDRVPVIRERFGAAGLQGFEQLSGPVDFSDDTQMTLYSADGLADVLAWARDGVGADEVACVWLAYLRWLQTQGVALPDSAPHPQPRWIDAQEILHHQRHPGNACLTGLSSGEMGTAARPVNPDSKGCGTVMRSAPFGLVPQLEPAAVLRLSADAASLTHGHPSARQSAAQFSLLIHELLLGATLDGAASALVRRLDEDPTIDPALRLRVSRAVELAGEGRRLSPEELCAELGEGWVAEEALAIALYAALATQTTGQDTEGATADGRAAAAPAERHFRSAVALAVNHDGDSDSTASLTGNILGVLYGEEALPGAWLRSVTGLDVVEHIADELARLVSE